MSLKEQVHAIVSCGTARFNPANLSCLSSYVDEQIQNNTYDIDNNLAVLSIYTLYPQLFDSMVCRKILIKALMQLPAVDMALCLSQIPESKQADPKIQPIIKLEDNLQSCKFKQVWDDLKDSAGPLPDLALIPGLHDALRRYIAEVVGLTYQSISINDLAAILHLPPGSQDFEKVIRTNGWTIDETQRSAVGGAVVRVSSWDDVGGTPGRTKTQSGGQKSVVEKNISVESLRACFATLSR